MQVLELLKYTVRQYADAWSEVRDKKTGPLITTTNIGKHASFVRTQAVQRSGKVRSAKASVLNIIGVLLNATASLYYNYI